MTVKMKSGIVPRQLGSPGSSVIKSLPAKVGDKKDVGLIPGS